jgi:hypothetical protein
VSNQREKADDPDENVQFDRAKFKDTVHYICGKCPADELGKVKLHKTLYFADMIHFVDTGTPLTELSPNLGDDLVGQAAATLG